jgi:hypothetical protein
MANPPSTDAVLVPPQLFPSTLFDLNHAIIWWALKCGPRHGRD